MDNILLLLSGFALGFFISSIGKQNKIDRQKEEIRKLKCDVENMKEIIIEGSGFLSSLKNPN